jgi:peptidoglycan hydrolase CwlO-like protein
MKRFLFISLSTISVIIPIIFLSYYGVTDSFGLLHFSLILMMILILNFILSIKYSIITPISVFISLKFKRIYFDDIDDSIYVYLVSNNTMANNLVRISIWKQNYTYMSKLSYIYAYKNDIENIKNEINKSLTNLYKKEIEEKKFKENIKNWNGSIDIITERNRKLNKILK